jgi:arylsulfatase A-like enzyme
LPPNILLIVTDDHPKRRTWKREVMPKTFSRMVDGGVEYQLGFTATPLCTPTRWSMISGRWQHNHRCTQNAANGYSEGKNKGLLNDTPATRLNE